MAVTPELDTAKLEQLFVDLGRSKSFLLDLADTYRTQCRELAAASGYDSHTLADEVHRIAGSSAMLAPSSTVDALITLEQVLRSDQSAACLLEETFAHLATTAELIEEWIQNLPELPSP